MTVQRFVALALPKNASQPPVYPIPTIPIEPARQAAVAEKFQVKTDGNILALCPGAEYGPAKRWPAEHFAELARKKIADGWQVWLFGSEKDRTVTEEINQIAADHASILPAARSWTRRSICCRWPPRWSATIPA